MTDPLATTARAPAAARPFPSGPRPRQFSRREFPVASVPRYRPVQQDTNSIGTAGSVLGLLGLVLCWVPIVGVLCGVLGVVFGGCGISRGRRNATGTGQAVTGLVLGLVSLVPAGIIIAAVVAA